MDTMIDDEKHPKGDEKKTRAEGAGNHQPSLGFEQLPKHERYRINDQNSRLMAGSNLNTPSHTRSSDPIENHEKPDQNHPLQRAASEPATRPVTSTLSAANGLPAVYQQGLALNTMILQPVRENAPRAESNSPLRPEVSTGDLARTRVISETPILGPPPGENITKPGAMSNRSKNSTAYIVSKRSFKELKRKAVEVTNSSTVAKKVRMVNKEPSEKIKARLMAISRPVNEMTPSRPGLSIPLLAAGQPNPIARTSNGGARRANITGPPSYPELVPPTTPKLVGSPRIILPGTAGHANRARKSPESGASAYNNVAMAAGIRFAGLDENPGLPPTATPEPAMPPPWIQRWTLGHARPNRGLTEGGDPSYRTTSIPGRRGLTGQENAPPNRTVSSFGGSDYSKLIPGSQGTTFAGPSRPNEGPRDLTPIGALRLTPRRTDHPTVPEARAEGYSHNAAIISQSRLAGPHNPPRNRTIVGSWATDSPTLVLSARADVTQFTGAVNPPVYPTTPSPSPAGMVPGFLPDQTNRTVMLGDSGEGSYRTADAGRQNSYVPEPFSAGIRSGPPVCSECRVVLTNENSGLYKADATAKWDICFCCRAQGESTLSALKVLAQPRVIPPRERTAILPEGLAELLGIRQRETTVAPAPSPTHSQSTEEEDIGFGAPGILSVETLASQIVDLTGSVSPPTTQADAGRKVSATSSTAQGNKDVIDLTKKSPSSSTSTPKEAPSPANVRFPEERGADRRRYPPAWMGPVRPALIRPMTFTSNRPRKQPIFPPDVSTKVPPRIKINNTWEYLMHADACIMRPERRLWIIDSPMSFASVPDPLPGSRSHLVMQTPESIANEHLLSQKTRESTQGKTAQQWARTNSTEYPVGQVENKLDHLADTALSQPQFPQNSWSARQTSSDSPSRPAQQILVGGPLQSKARSPHPRPRASAKARSSSRNPRSNSEPGENSAAGVRGNRRGRSIKRDTKLTTRKLHVANDVPGGGTIQHSLGSPGVGGHRSFHEPENIRAASEPSRTKAQERVEGGDAGMLCSLVLDPVIGGTAVDGGTFIQPARLSPCGLTSLPATSTEVATTSEFLHTIEGGNDTSVFRSGSEAPKTNEARVTVFQQALLNGFSSSSTPPMATIQQGHSGDEAPAQHMADAPMTDAVSALSLHDPVALSAPTVVVTTPEVPADINSQTLDTDPMVE